MGYKAARRYTLQFNNREGLIVVCKGSTIGEAETLTELGSAVDKAENVRDRNLRLADLFNFFEKKIIEWNIDHGEVIQPGPEGECSRCGLREDDAVPPFGMNMFCLDLDLVMETIQGWQLAVARASIPKGMSLNVGGNSGPLALPADGMPESMRTLAEMQNPMRLPELNFTSD